MRVLAEMASTDISWAESVVGTLSVGTHTGLGQIVQNLKLNSQKMQQESFAEGSFAEEGAQKPKQVQQLAAELDAPVTAEMHAAKLRYENARRQKKQKR